MNGLFTRLLNCSCDYSEVFSVENSRGIYAVYGEICSYVHDWPTLRGRVTTGKAQELFAAMLLTLWVSRTQAFRTGLGRPPKRRKTEFERTFSATGQESEEAAAARAQFQGVRPLGRPTGKRSAPVCHGLRPRSFVGLRPHWSCQVSHPRVAGV